MSEVSSDETMGDFIKNRIPNEGDSTEIIYNGRRVIVVNRGSDKSGYSVEFTTSGEVVEWDRGTDD